ncbi:MAG: adenylate kinase [Clostridiales bacterium]|nr:adenylate kinase [Clostridiales bacterium]
MRLVILGASGAGKGTQAQALAKHFGMKHISTGDILREEVKKDSAICRAVKRLMDRGDLVPDELMLSILEGILVEEDNFILDGYPRTFSQALALNAICDRLGTPIDVAVSIEVPDDEVIQRITGRTVCSKCATMFHTIFLPPKVHGICDVCGATLTQRPDDTMDTVKHRLKLFHALTEPIIDFYRRQGILISRNGVGDAEEIAADLIKTLEEKS